MPRRLLLENLPGIVAAQLRIALDALRNIRGAAARQRLRGQIAGILGLPRQLRKRRIIQAEKRVDAAAIRQQLTNG